MSAKTDLNGTNSFLTCSEDMFEGFIRERLNSSTEDDADEEMETEPIGNDVLEVVAGEESSADSTSEMNDNSDRDEEKSINNVEMGINNDENSVDNEEESIDNNSDRENPVRKPIVVSSKNPILKSYFNKKTIENPVISKAKSIKVVKKLPVFKNICPKSSQTQLNNGFIKLSPTKLNNGLTKLSPTKANSGIFLVKSPVTEGASTKNAKEIILNSGKKLVLIPQKNLIANESESLKRKLVSISGTPEKGEECDDNEAIPVSKKKCIVLNKPINVVQGADRKSLDISGISLLAGSFNGHVSKKVEVNIAASSHDTKLNPEAQKNVENILEGSSEHKNEQATDSKVVFTAKPDAKVVHFKQPVQLNQLNGQKTLVAKKPISLDSATHKKLLSLMKNSGEDKFIYVPNSAIRFKPISKHSVQCVIDKNSMNGVSKEQMVENADNNSDKSHLIKSQNSRVTLEPKTQRIIILNNDQKSNKHELSGSLKKALVSVQSISNQTQPVSTSSDEQSTVLPLPSKQMSETSTNTSEMDIARSSTSAPVTDYDLSEMYLEQLTIPAIPKFEPPPQPAGTKMLACAECKDKFTQQSSLDFHRARRSVLIGYWCSECGRRLSFFNRCALLKHLRGHNHKLSSMDASCISIDPIPRNLITFGNSYTEQSMSNSSKKIINKVVVKAPDTIATKPTPASTCNNVSTQMNLVGAGLLNVGEDVPSGDIEDEIRDANEGARDLTAVKEVPAEVTSTESRSIAAIVPVDISLKVNAKNVTDSTNKTPDMNEIFTDTPPVLSTWAQSNQNSNNARDPKPLKSRPVKRISSCPECKASLGTKTTLQKHLLNDNRPSNPCLRCKDCNLILPTRCSLRMHLRMHIPIKPYRCPECGIEYNMYERFIMHLKFECCHLAKTVKYMCTLCNVPEPSMTRLRVHVLDFHTRRIIKCNNCSLAFKNTKSIARHHKIDHPNILSSSTYFSTCRFCPGKLVPQKKFANHVAKHITSDNFKIYVYECYQCKTCFLEKKDLIEHLYNSCSNNGDGRNGNGNDGGDGGNGDGRNGHDNNGDGRNGHGNNGDGMNDNGNNVSKPSNLAADLTASNSVEVDEASQADNVVEIQEEPANEVEVLVPVQESLTIDVVEICEQDPLSLEGFQVEEPPVIEPKIELCVLCKKQRVVIQPGENAAQQSLCCRDCVRPCSENDLQPRQPVINTRRKPRTQTIYRCKMCSYLTIVDFDMLVRHFRRRHKDVSDANIKHYVAIELKNIYHSVTKSKTVSAADSIKDKYLRKKKANDSSADTYRVEEQMEIDDDDDDDDGGVVEVRNEKAPRRPPKQISVAPSGLTQFDRGLVISSKPTDNNLKCSKCNFKALHLADLRRHVPQHRTDPSAPQCLDCGECFVVLPSLEKHLAIRHRILDVDKYIADNPNCLPPDSSVDSLKCSVCLTMFESRHALDKHFRIHGMAFLKQTRPIS